MILRSFFFLFVVTCPLAACALLYRAARSRGRLSGLDAVLLAGLWWCLHLTAVALILGFSGLYAPVPLAVAAALSHGLWLPIWLRGHKAARRCSLLGVCGSFFRRYRVFIVVLLLCVGVFFVRVGTAPLSDYDTLFYHLPFVCESVQEGRFVVHPSLEHDPIGYYPYNWEALSGIFLMAQEGWTLLRFANVVAFAILILSLYGLARHAGASRDASAGMALSVAGMPIVAGSVTSMQVDLAFAAFFFAGLYFGLRFALRGHPASLFAMFGAGGMLGGLKVSGPAYCVLIAVILLLHPGFLARFRKAALWKGRLWGVVLFLVFSAPWYIRNMLLTGNPLGVVRVALGPVVLFEGTRVEFYRTTLFAVWDWGRLADYAIVGRCCMSACGVSWLLLVELGMVCIVVLPPRFRRPRTTPLFIGIALACAAYLVTPYSGDNGTFRFRLTPWMGQAIRYAFPLLGSLAVGAAQGFGACGRMGRFALVAGGGLCLWGMGEVVYGGGPPLPLLVFAVALVCFFGFGGRLRRMSTFMLLFVWLALAVLSLAASIPEMDRERRRLMPDWHRQLMEFLDMEQVDRLGFMRSHKTGLWYGQRLQIRPVPLRGEDPAQLAQEMAEQRLQVLIVGPWGEDAEAPERFPARLRDSGRFELLLHNPVGERTWVFRLRGANPTGVPRASDSGRFGTGRSTIDVEREEP